MELLPDAQYSQILSELTAEAEVDLINAGAVAGDVVQGEDGTCFRPWPITPPEAIDRITLGLQERYTCLGQPGGLGWLHFPGWPARSQSRWAGRSRAQQRRT
ncbi:MAG TPA: hypothetical protein VLW50_07650 [Streptosporangiaceae bacterium]|nr:hypothetical protein [Streptosporangiaceae bacterium]